MRTPIRAYVTALAPAALVMTACIAQPWVKPAHLLGDPVTILGSSKSFYLGAASHFGVLTLVATAGVLGLMAFAPRQVAEERAFLGLSGLASLAIALDDLFIFHEYVAPQVLGIQQLYVLLLYLIGGAIFLIAFRHRIWAGEAGLFGLAMAAMAASVVVDMVEWRLPIPYDIEILFEDGLKLTGYLTWATFFWRRAHTGLA
jgi:hypothetical protein